MPQRLALYDVVALTANRPEDGLVQGQVGTIVLELASDAMEVEFVDENGRTYALATVPAAHLMRLHYHRVQAA